MGVPTLSYFSLSSYYLKSSVGAFTDPTGQWDPLQGGHPPASHGEHAQLQPCSRPSPHNTSFTHPPQKHMMAPSYTQTQAPSPLSGTHTCVHVHVCAHSHFPVSSNVLSPLLSLFQILCVISQSVHACSHECIRVFKCTLVHVHGGGLEFGIY